MNRSLRKLAPLAASQRQRGAATAKLKAAPAAQLSPALLQQCAGQAAALLRALANPDRLMLVCHLVEGEKTVGELGALAGIGQPSLSQQLGVLREEGLVATRREGKHIHYRIGSPQVSAVLQTLHGVYCAPSAVAAH
jgi:ArsR family transcriptional regulator